MSEEKKEPWINHMALVTVILAVCATLSTFKGGSYSTQSVISQALASDQWAFFQAKSTKQSLAEASRDLMPADRQPAYQAKIDRYEKEKNEIKSQAEAIENAAKEWDRKSDEQMHLHHRWAQATTALQVSIALAAIALLTKKKWLEWGMFGVGAVGLGIGALALAHI